MSSATVGNGLEVKASTLKHAGNGCFTTKTFKKGEYVTEYDGQRIGWEDAKRRRRLGIDAYIRTLYFGWIYIDGLCDPEAVKGKGGGSFVNDGKDCKINNLTWYLDDREGGTPRMLLKASRNIQTGEELFVSYGKTYWRQRR